MLAVCSTTCIVVPALRAVSVGLSRRRRTVPPGAAKDRLAHCHPDVNCVAAAGGTTTFGKLGLTVNPRRGQGLLFFPASKTGEFDERVEHQGGKLLSNSLSFIHCAQSIESRTAGQVDGRTDYRQCARQH